VRASPINRFSKQKRPARRAGRFKAGAGLCHIRDVLQNKQIIRTLGAANLLPFVIPAETRLSAPILEYRVALTALRIE
jgi:hypothetical protein